MLVVFMGSNTLSILSSISLIHSCNVKRNDSEMMHDSEERDLVFYVHGKQLYGHAGMTPTTHFLGRLGPPRWLTSTS